MLTADDITTALRQHLPSEYHSAIPALAQALADVAQAATNGTTTGALSDVQARLAAHPNLAAALRALAGQEVSAGGSVISFGVGAQMGDVSIGDVAGRDVVKIHLDVHQTIGTQQVINAQSGANIGNVIGSQANYYNAAPVRSPLEQRNRQAMLKKVESIWVTGMLGQSLYRMARIELGLEYDDKAVSHPWDEVVCRPDRADELLRPGTPTVKVFDSLAGELLILGAPGSGKSTALLELTRDLIARALHDELHPIPVVFNLSSWAVQRPPLIDWLKSELNLRYDIPKKIAAEWVDTKQILPLLDGLDEVTEEHREACAEAINTFRQNNNGLVPLAVCSRVADYAALTTKLRLQGAVVIQPLDRQQVERYLLQAGGALAGVRTALVEDPTLFELLDSPLMLSIVALTYQGRFPTKVRLAGTVEERRTRLFDSYIDRMFNREGRNADKGLYPKEQTTHWLAWLAYQLDSHEMTAYYIEEMQPDWLAQRQRLWYKGQSSVFPSLATGLAFILGVWPLYGVIAGVIAGVIVGVIVGLISITFGEDIDSVEDLNWSWPKFWSGWHSPIVLTGIFVIVYTVSLIGELVFRIDSFMAFGLVLGLGGVLIYEFLSGLSTGLKIQKIKVKIVPNQGIGRSVRNGIVSGLIICLVSGPYSALLLTLVGVAYRGVNLPVSLVFGLLFGLFSGLLFGLTRGGLAAIQHYSLRYFLLRQGSLPFRDLIPWLDSCVDRLFLRRVGGGYIFIHRMLMEHFAAMTDEDIARLSGEIEGQGRSSKGAR